MPSIKSCRRTVLLVDENRFTHQLLAIDLSAGYTVLSAHDSDEALAIVSTKKVDAIAVNMTMPGLEAADLVRPILARDLGIPVVVLGIDCSTAEREELVRLGAQDVINHPASLLEIIARLSLAMMTSRRPQLSVITDMLRQGRREKSADVAWYELPRAMTAAANVA